MSSPISSKGAANRYSSSEENQVAPARRVVRQLKPPPEIWELVHPVSTQKFKPGRSFFSRLSSSWMTLVLLAFCVGVLVGVGAAFWKHPAAKAFLSNLQLQTENPQQKPVLVEPATTAVPQNNSQSTSTAETTAPPTETTSTTSSATVPTTAESAPEALGASEQTQSALKFGSSTARRRNNQRQSTANSGAATGVTVSAPATSNAQRATVPDSQRATQRNSTDPASTKAKPSSPENSQAPSPVKPAAPQKAKVIPWP